MWRQFEWHEGKARLNPRKHGVSFDEVRTVFLDRLATIFDDPDHSADERREFIIGRSSSERLLFVSFTERNGKIRIISARLAIRFERSDHEEGF